MDGRSTEDAGIKRQIRRCRSRWTEVEMLISTTGGPEVHQAVVDDRKGSILNLDCEPSCDRVREGSRWNSTSCAYGRESRREEKYSLRIRGRHVRLRLSVVSGRELAGWVDMEEVRRSWQFLLLSQELDRRYEDWAEDHVQKSRRYLQCNNAIHKYEGSRIIYIIEQHSQGIILVDRAGICGVDSPTRGAASAQQHKFKLELQVEAYVNEDG